MHRTYSLRTSRAPTASQVANPPPPPSTTKSHRFFGKGSICKFIFNYIFLQVYLIWIIIAGTFRKQTAAALQPDLAKKLAQLIKLEKNVLRSIELSARERRSAAKQLSIWGQEKEDDISDITDKLGVLLYEIGELEDQYIDKYDQYRISLKSIRNIEASVQPTRDRKQKITDNIAQLKYKDPQSPQITVLEQELVRAEAESLVADAQLSNITREKLKAAFNYQFDALSEHAEKLALIAGYGKALLELLDDSAVTPGETRPTYDGYEASKQVIVDTENALAHWTVENASVKPTLSLRYDDELEEDEEEDELNSVTEGVDDIALHGDDHIDGTYATTHPTAKTVKVI